MLFSLFYPPRVLSTVEREIIMPKVTPEDINFLRRDRVRVNCFDEEWRFK